MKNEQKFFVCKHCGNIVGTIYNSGVLMVCCGENMIELVANTSDGAVEKHIPVVEINGSTVIVKVGSAIHPMTSEHSIEWIYLQLENGGQRKCLAKDKEPIAEFALAKDDKLLAVYAYCNLHGLWKKEI